MSWVSATPGRPRRRRRWSSRAPSMLMVGALGVLRMYRSPTHQTQPVRRRYPPNAGSSRATSIAATPHRVREEARPEDLDVTATWREQTDGSRGVHHPRQGRPAVLRCRTVGTPEIASPRDREDQVPGDGGGRAPLPLSPTCSCGAGTRGLRSADCCSGAQAPQQGDCITTRP